MVRIWEIQQFPEFLETFLGNFYTICFCFQISERFDWMESALDSLSDNFIAEKINEGEVKADWSNISSCSIRWRNKVHQQYPYTWESGRHSDTLILRNLLSELYCVLICFQSHNLTYASNNSGILYWWGFGCSSISRVVRNIVVKSTRKELTVRIATKNLAGNFLPQEGHNFTLKTSSIPWLASKESLLYIFYRHAQEVKANMENSKRTGCSVITKEWKLQNEVILK